jgi:hypothetical protein
MKKLSKTNKDIENNIILVIVCVNFLVTLFLSYIVWRNSIQLFKLNQTVIDTNLYQSNEINCIKGLKVCDKNFTKARREINLSGN